VASYFLDSSILRFKKCLLCVYQGSNKEWEHVVLSSLFVSASIKESQKFIFSRNFPALVSCKTSKFVTKETSLLLRQTPWHLMKPPIKGAFLWGDPDQWSKITRIMVHQRNRRVHSGHGFIGSFDAPWFEWSWATDPDPDHPKGMHPNVISGWGDSLTDVGYNFGQVKIFSFNTSCWNAPQSYYSIALCISLTWFYCYHQSWQQNKNALFCDSTWLFDNYISPCLSVKWKFTF